MDDSKPKWTTSSAAAALMALGVVLRVRPYLANRSLWIDEAFLVLNILERDFGRLLQPLDHLQAAPVGFLVLERLVVLLLGPREFALRLLPLLFSVGSVFLFWHLARRLLPSSGALLALAMFALSEQLIYYASEVKPYGIDVTVAVLLWWLITQSEREGTTWRDLAVVGVVGAAAVWLSYPAIIVLGGLAIRWLWAPMRRGRWPTTASRAVVSGAWVLSFALAYVTSMHRIGGNPELRDAWASATAPLIPRAVSDLDWYVGAVAALASLPLGRAVDHLVLVAVIIGSVARRDLLASVAGPIALSWLAAVVGKYPMAARLWLFLAPFVIVLAAAGLVDTWRRTRAAMPLLGSVLIVLLFAYPALRAARDVLRPRQVEEVRPLLEHARDHYRTGDALYLYYWTEFPARYYAACGLAFPGEVIVGSVGGSDGVETYARDADRFKRGGRVWLLFSHVQSPHGLDEEALLLRNVNRIGQELEAQRRTGASLYLYEVAPSKP